MGFRVKIKIDENSENEVIIKTASLNEDVLRIQRFIENGISSQSIALTLGECEYFIPVSKILFFESYDGKTVAHTADRMLYSSM